MKFNIVFSILVHESYDVVFDQIHNYMRFNPGSAIVLHLAKNFNNEGSNLDEKSFRERCPSSCVLINPSSVRTGFFDIIQAHFANFKYVRDIIDFDYFIMCASNELCVREGLYSHISNYDCGIGKKDYSLCKWKGDYKNAKMDDCLTKMREELCINTIYWSQIEGTYYKKDLFNSVCLFIERHYNYLEMKHKYAREEIYFPCVVFGLIHIGEINVEILTKDTYLTYIPWRRATLTVTLNETIKLTKAKGSRYAIKRVNRRIDDYVRSYLRQSFDYQKNVIDGGVNCPNYDLKEIHKLALKSELVQSIHKYRDIIVWYNFLFNKKLRKIISVG